MSHTYNIECGQCSERFCECHPYWFVDEGENEGEEFCCEKCVRGYFEDNKLTGTIRSVHQPTIKLKFKEGEEKCLK